MKNVYKEPLWVYLPIEKIPVLNAQAVTLWPFVFYTKQAQKPSLMELHSPEDWIVAHETVHWNHQRNMGGPVGLPLWLIVYLALWPILSFVYIIFAHRKMKYSEHPLETDAVAAGNRLK